MIREIIGIASPADTVRIAVAVEPLVMVTHDRSDLGVVVDLRKNPLADLRVPLHEATLLKRECAWLLEQPGRKPDLADVVNEPGHMSQLLLELG